ncbi:MAG: hypothetical protein FD549_000070 [Pelagibacterales bacterium]|nr:hypothetical protein [Pelagibacterales bacterium]|tara:strand:+ start:236 stop:967 length:732 start_codon:yes stop_codon:yes gene_type:complete
MKYKLILILFLISSCAAQQSKNYDIKTYSSKGFAYVYDESDYIKKITSKKFNNELLSLGSSDLRTGTLVRVTNPENKKFITLKILKKTKYPEFYKILITKAVADKLILNTNDPLVDIEELKKNKSFTAAKSETFKEEQKIHNKAPVTNVTVNNISKNKFIKVNSKKYSIIVASFYNNNSALILKNKIKSELTYLDFKKMLIKTNKKNTYQLILGPYNTINLLKNDYISLKDYGFEELEIKIHD